MHIDNLIHELASLSIAIRLNDEQRTTACSEVESKRVRLKGDYFRALHAQLLDNLHRSMDLRQDHLIHECVA